jgi:hypothetical protein
MEAEDVAQNLRALCSSKNKSIGSDSLFDRVSPERSSVVPVILRNKEMK